MPELKLKEKRVHIDECGFPVQLYENHGNIFYHWHDEYEFLYISRGNALCRIDTEIYNISEGECAIFTSGQLHTVYSDDETSLEYYAIVFQPDLVFGDFGALKKYLSREYTIKPKLSPLISAEKAIINQILRIRGLSNQKPFGYELSIKAVLTAIFAQIFSLGLYELNREDSTRLAAKNNLSRAVHYIHANYKKKITLYELSQVVGYNQQYFVRFFKENTGKTPVSYINSYRVYKACELFRTSDLSVLEVAYECGFENVGYFIRTFKKQMNMTPLKYKMNIKNNVFH